MKNTTGDVFDILRVVCEWRLRSRDTDGQYCALQVTIPAGCVVPLHQHAEQEAFFILEGAVEFAETRNGALHWRTLRVGEMFNIPSDAVHGFRNLSRDAAKGLLTAHAGMEGFFLDAGTPVPSNPAPPTRAEIERLISIATEHGHRFLPPESAA